jgi:integrase/recombinase XerC
MKFLTWFESNHRSLISKTKGATIGHYKEFLTNGGRVYSTPSTKEKFLGTFKKTFLSLFKKKAKSLPCHVIFEQKPLAVSSRRRHLSAVKNFFEYLKQSHEDKGSLFAKNPVKSKIHAIKLKEMDVKPTKNLRREDWNKIDRMVIKPKERLIVGLLYWGGLRLSELCDLKIENFDTDSRSLKFIRKGGYVHTLILQRGKEIFDSLDYHLLQREVDCEYVFTNRSGKKISTKTMYNHIMRILLKAGCSEGLTPHSFRKACATNLYLRHQDLLLVRDYLNHTDAKITQTYIDKQTIHGVHKEQGLYKS